MNNFQFWQRWLLVVSVVIVVFGLMMAFFNGTVLFQIFDRLINPVFWSAGELPEGVNEFQRFVYGVLGATMAGWGIFITFMAQYPFKSKERWAWNCIALGLGVWYVADTGISLYHGVSFNALFNTVLMIVVVPPLVFTRKEFQG